MADRARYRDHRRPGQLSRLYRAGLGPHTRTARPIGGDSDALILGQQGLHRPKGRNPAASARAGNLADGWTKVGTPTTTENTTATFTEHGTSSQKVVAATTEGIQDVVTVVAGTRYVGMVNLYIETLSAGAKDSVWENQVSQIRRPSTCSLTPMNRFHACRRMSPTA